MQNKLFLVDDNLSAIGVVPINPTTGTASQGFVSDIAFARPDNADAYTANDVVGAVTGASAAFELEGLGTPGGTIRIVGSRLRIDLDAVPASMTSFRLALYSVTPPSALADNAAWNLPAGDRASFLGFLDLGSPLDVGSTLYVEQSSLNKQVQLPADSSSIFAYLITAGGYTPAAGTTFFFELATLAA